MKKTLLLVAALFYFVGLNAQGVIFEKGTWKEVLEKANRENKIIFVDIYTSWCGPCKLMASKEFVQEKAGEYFNPRFVSVKIFR
jgi:thiol-disulfide isomerase/thioredoxin